MNKQTRVRIEMIQAAAEFCAALNPGLPPGSAAARLLAELQTTRQQLELASGTQHGSRLSQREQVRRKRDAAARLLREMRQIARLAKVVEPAIPGVLNRFRIGGRPQNFLSLLTQARAFHAAATELREEFLAADAPADFPAQLAAEIQVAESANAEKVAGLGNQVESTQRLRQLTREGVRKVRQLDAILRIRFAADQPALAEWEALSRIRNVRAAKPAAATS